MSGSSIKKLSENGIPATRSLKKTALLQIRAHLRQIYGAQRTNEILPRLVAILDPEVSKKRIAHHANKWSEKDIIVITYGDNVQKEGEKPLKTLHGLAKKYLKNYIEAIHILPFFPYSSDDGFSITDYEEVNLNLGNWSDIEAIASDFDLMADLVMNHVSRQHKWFKQFVNGEEPGRNYFIELSPFTDVSKVVRPRSHPLLVPVETKTGVRHVWATFSEDQIDLNMANPDVLLEFVKIIILYLKKGIRFIRLDAIGFLWKDVGTPSIHLPETHEIVRLIRLIAEMVNPNVIIITETNVPNRENLSYFGNMNEAHMIYNFSLPPLVLDALIRSSSEHLMTWMMSMPPAPMGCAYLNFTASHDGIGLRPAEGLMTPKELQTLIETMQAFGGQISHRMKPDGRKVPYEINIALWDALQGNVHGPDEWQLERFLCSQIIMMSLEGVPAFYIQSLFATPNDEEAFIETGQKRAINRHKWQLKNLDYWLQDDNSTQSKVYNSLLNLLKLRREQKAFHPNATQFTLHLGDPFFAFWRQSIRRDQSIFVICNVTDELQSLALSDLNLTITESWCDLIGGYNVDSLQSSLTLQPYQCIWLSNKC